jgi:hypothetical protein
MKVSTRRMAERAKTALRDRFVGSADRQGYVNWPQSNLIHGVRLDQFEDDLRRGDGNELRIKFCAVHSSAALAVNCFAPFKDRPEEIHILGRSGAVAIEFEKRLKIFSDRRPCNLDVWIDRGAGAVAIESKLLEYLEPKIAEFAPAYERLAPPESETCWWAVCDEARRGGPQLLDRAQLVKHYFGLSRLLQSGAVSKDLTLLYLFWEPLNWPEIPECLQHRKELEDFAGMVAGSSISFKWTTYSQLWDEWVEIAALAEHASNLKSRYEVCL